MRKRTLRIAICLIGAPVFGLADDAAMAFVRASQAAESENAKRAAQYVYDERVTQWRVERGGERKRLRVQEYEVIAIEGAPYYRLMRQNGKPLTGRDLANEDQRMAKAAEERRRAKGSQGESERRRHNIGLKNLPERHTCGFLDDDAVDGIETKVVLCRPKLLGDVDPLDGIEVKLWIEPVSKLRLRIEVEYLLPQGHFSIGSKVTYTGHLTEDGTLLVSAIIAKRPNPNKGDKVLSNETEQIYSRFRKFAASSTIRIDEVK